MKDHDQLSAPSSGARLETARELRPDIQALRGLAILLVVFYHARLGPFPGAGYLGVDIFFVVSGYLITGIVQRGLADGSFRFREFYFRRAKRLLPAAYVVFSACVLAAPFFLPPMEIEGFAKQVIGAVTFTANIVLLMQSGYFESATQLKPLLHVWSLAIEEQYYLLMPAMLAFTPRRWWLIVFCALATISLALCLLMLSSHPVEVFYLLPTRAWELMLGSLGAFITRGERLELLSRKCFWPALATLLLVPFFPLGAGHPGIDSLLVCVSTLIIILSRHPIGNRGLPSRSLAAVGNISYSLYLLHWPLLAFAGNVWVTPVPGSVRLSLVISAALLAVALHRWVEEPLRRATVGPSRGLVALLVLSSAMIAAGALGLPSWDERRSGAGNQFEARANYGFDEACENSDSFSDHPACRSSEQPEVLVWGDSYAMHLVDAIEAGHTGGLIQATKSYCGPLLGVAAFREGGYFNRLWAQGCLAFNASVIEFLASAKSVETVVLSSMNEQYLAGHRVLLVDSPRGGEADSPGESNVDPLSEQGGDEVAVLGYVRTVSAIRALGKRVVIVSPPPVAGFDLGRCLQLRTGGRMYFGAEHADCSISEDGVLERRADVWRLLDRVADEADVEVIRLDSELCGSGRCVVEIDGVALFRDGGHLTRTGSRLVGQRIKLAERIHAVAR